MIPQRSRSGKGLDGRFGTYTHTQPNSRYSTRTQLCSQFVQLKNRLADLEKCIHLRVHNLSPGLSYCICCGFAMEKRITGTGRRGGFFKCNRHIGNPPAADYKFCNSCGTHITFAQFQQYMAEDYPFELELARETRLEKVEFNRAGWAIVYELVQSDMELSDFIRLLRDLRLSDIPLTFSPFSSLVEARHSLRSIPTLEACLKSFALKPDPKDEEPIDDYSPVSYTHLTLPTICSV